MQPSINKGCIFIYTLYIVPNKKYLIAKIKFFHILKCGAGDRKGLP